MFAFSFFLCLLCSFSEASIQTTAESLTVCGQALYDRFEALGATDPFLPSNLIRLAFHDAGTYSEAEGNGGSHAVQWAPCSAGQSCENNHPSNNGLAFGRDELTKLHANKCSFLSMADLAQFAAGVAIQYTGGPFYPFCYGRTDEGADKSYVGRLPGADNKGTKEIFETLGKGRLGLTCEEIVALLGAHTVGFMHIENSNHFGPWDKTPYTWDIGYFNELYKVFHDMYYNPNLNQFELYEEVGGLRAMVQADAALMRDEKTIKIIEKFRNDVEAWHEAFGRAWWKVQLAGHNNLKSPDTHQLCVADHSGGVDPATGVDGSTIPDPPKGEAHPDCTGFACPSQATKGSGGKGQGKRKRKRFTY